MGELDVAIVGAGPAGLSVALDLSRRGWRVLVAEARRGRRRHLCGEFLSGDGWQALEGLDVARALLAEGCPSVHRARVTLPRGPVWQADVPGLGRGCSRQLLADALEAAAVEAGARVRRGLRLRPDRRSRPDAGEAGIGWTAAPDLGARLTLWAGGQSGAAALEHTAAASPRRQRGGPGHRGYWLGVAVHGRARGAAAEPSCVRLHAAAGGYVGVGAIEGERVNVCGLLPARRAWAGDPLRALDAARSGNRFLDNELRDIELDESSVVTVAGLDFQRRLGRAPLSVGDAQAAPAPVLGQGLAAALCGGRLLATWVDRHLRGEIDADALVAGYRHAWRARFGPRLRRGRWLHAGLQRPWLAWAALHGLRRLPSLSAHLVRATRGPLPAAEPPASAPPTR